MLLTTMGSVYAKELPRERVINAIIGEAEGEGYQGMLAVACAIRNRGTLKGVYGEHSKRVKEHLYSEKTYRMAVKALEMALKCDITNGATHWEGTAFKVPSWAKRMQITVVIGRQRFYK
jgi:spore germination cell wall hydrolase CwlJ-like protein